MMNPRRRCFARGGTDVLPQAHLAARFQGRGTGVRSVPAGGALRNW
jgi:hypothetical protein